MNMKKVLVSAVAAGLLATPAFGGATFTQMNGNVGPFMSNGLINAYPFQAFGGGPAGFPNQPSLYNNIPTFAGGGATAGTDGVFGLPLTYVFSKWGLEPLEWGDDVHDVVPGVMTNFWYGYYGLGVTTTHVIKLYDMVPPSLTHGPDETPITSKGALIASIVVPAAPAGPNYVAITGLSIAVPSAMWVKMQAPAVGELGVYWLSGGRPVLGSSHNGITQSLKAPFTYYYTYNGLPYTLYYPGDWNNWEYYPNGYIPFSGGAAPTAPNLSIGMSDRPLPAPGVISLLGLGGLVALRRRRIRA
jgi:hypothetical protein